MLNLKNLRENLTLRERAGEATLPGAAEMAGKGAADLGTDASGEAFGGRDANGLDHVASGVLKLE